MNRLHLAAVFAGVVLAACQKAPAPTTRILSDPVTAAPGQLRVLVYHDMEGLAGQSDPSTFRFNHPDAYRVGQEMLAADLNAVIDGLFAAGATSVHVVDAHGSGNPEPDVRRDLLDPRAQQVFRTQPFQPYVDLVEPNRYEAVVAVGMHAKTGSRGFASHTYTLGMDILLNGESITESELVALSWGRVGVPMIMVTGDDRLQADLATMPWLSFVVTKRAVAADSAEPRPVAEVHAEMRAVAERALRARDSARVVTVVTPVRAALRAVPPADLSLLEKVPGLDYREQQVEFTAPDLAAAYDGIVALIGVARQAYSRLLIETIRRQPEGERVMLEYSDFLFRRWMDVESGRWTPVPPPSPPGDRRYHGAN